MGVIDSDAHILETSKTWDYLEGEDKRFTPFIGTDYGHRDPSSEVLAVKLLREDSCLDKGVADKILEQNPRALYGIDQL